MYQLLDTVNSGGFDDLVVILDVLKQPMQRHDNSISKKKHKILC